jgi:hypothetical protein
MADTLPDPLLAVIPASQPVTLLSIDETSDADVELTLQERQMYNSMPETVCITYPLQLFHPL